MAGIHLHFGSGDDLNLYNIQHGEVVRLWSEGSVNTGKYVRLTNHKVRNEEFLVNSSGSGQDNVDIKFVQMVAHPKAFALVLGDLFQYYLKVTPEEAVAVPERERPSLFESIQMRSPNRPYFVFRTYPDGKTPLYLSSNCKGKMKLKTWNPKVPPPPNSNDRVDPDLLFRVVDPPFHQD